jgi:FkbM family methyltransferase
MKKFSATEFLGLEEVLEVLDIGAAGINETPIYTHLLNCGTAHLNTFEGDRRQHESIKERFGTGTTVFEEFLFDGTEQTVYMASPASGMTSLLKPNAKTLGFFNGFTRFGEIHTRERVQTTRLDEVKNLPPIDFAKLDVQGSELTILQNGKVALQECLAVQLEVSFLCLYENQPSFGEIDHWMRNWGFVPHMFVDVKKWSISPTIFGGNFRIPGNQLLEADILYIRDPMEADQLSDTQLRKLAVMSHFLMGSVDLCGHWIISLINRGVLPKDSYTRYLERWSENHPHPLGLS